MTKIPLSQTDLLTIAMVKLAYVKQDWLDFTDFNTVKFDTNFVQDYEAAIVAARDVPKDEVVQDRGTELNNLLKEKETEARRLYRYIKYFVEEAYEANEGRKNLFGLDDYKATSGNVTKLLVFLSNLYEQCIAYEQELVNAGINTRKIQELATVRDELQTALIQKKEHSGKRMETTQDRQAIFLTLFSFIQAVCRAGKVIYKDVNEAKYRRYLMPKASNVKRDAQEIIEAHTQKTIEDDSLTADTLFEIVNTGTVELLFYTAENIADATPPNAIALQANESRSIKLSDISNGSYNLLIAQNDTDMKGSCKIFRMDDTDD